MVTPSGTKRIPHRPSLIDALIPVIFLIIALGAAVFIYGGEAIGGPVQVAMFLAAVVAGLVGYKNGHSVARMTKAAVDSIGTAMGAMFILLSVGALIGTWNMSGTIATMTDWGIRILSPNWFFLTAAIICALIALSIGSSWTVMGTIGVALIAIASALGLSETMAAGAVISGAYFGDKMSPLSETTNLAPAVAGTDLYTHIRAMLATTVPSILIALGLFTFFGLTADPEGGINVDTGLQAIEETFTTGIIQIIPLIVVIVMALRKAPPTLAIITGALVGGIVAVLTQAETVENFAAASREELGLDPLGSGWLLLQGVWDAMATGFVPDTGSEALDELLAGGGMQGLLGTIWLIMVALAFGGIMNMTGFLARIIEPLHRAAKNDRGVMVATGTTAIGINVLAADQYLAIVLTGNVYKQDFEERGIAPQTLSRQIEDTATITSVLIPWNSCGAYASGVLGVETIAYAPFAFFNWINPIVSFIYALLGLQIQRAAPETHFPDSPNETEFYGVSGQRGDEVPVEGDKD
jgi:NhaC family Na+:H+ antiporter